MAECTSIVETKKEPRATLDYVELTPHKKPAF